ncbi:MAG: prepilin-type N-terminal cleavage/methylation domain-containing protein [Clostridium sp.]
MNKLKKRRKGFTLIEMVVVIAIVVIIAAIAIPQALKAINKSKASTDIANARTYAGQIMSRSANGDISAAGMTSLKGTNGVALSSSNSADILGGEVAVLKLAGTGNSYVAKYTTDANGNDKITILVGTGAATDKEIYPTVATGSDYANYIK